MLLRDGRHRGHLYLGFGAFLLASLLFCVRTRAAPGAGVIWMARSYGGTAIWSQVHPSGHAWLQLRSLGENSSKLAVFATVELALRFDPAVYRSLHGSFTRAGVRPGDHVAGTDSLFGIAPVANQRTHSVSDADARSVLDPFSEALNTHAAGHHAKWDSLLRALRSAGLGCVVRPSATAGLLYTDPTKQDAQPAKATGEACLLSDEIRTILSTFAGPAIAQIAFEVTIKTVPTYVEVTTDDKLQLHVNDQALASTGMWSVQSEGSTARVWKGNWRELDVRIRPTSMKSGDALVHVVPGLQLQMERDLWHGDLSIALKSRAPRPGPVVSRPVDSNDPLAGLSENVDRPAENERDFVARFSVIESRMAARGGRIVKCVGMDNCDKLSLEELRGLAAEAFGKCAQLGPQVTSKVDARGSLELHVRIGSKSCSVAIHDRQCLKPGDSLLGTEYLFRRLSRSPSEDVRYLTAHAVCRSRKGLVER